MSVIKRYPNRKLYNTSSKQYITLEGIADMIRNGEEVQILDHNTGEDLTALTLTQIIFEQEKKQGGFLPRSVLTGLVQAGGFLLASPSGGLKQTERPQASSSAMVIRRLFACIILPVCLICQHHFLPFPRTAGRIEASRSIADDSAGRSKTPEHADASARLMVGRLDARVCAGSSPVAAEDLDRRMREATHGQSGDREGQHS